MKKYVYGINTVEEILKYSKRNIYRLIVENVSASKLMPLIKLANKRKISVQFAPYKLLDKLTEKANHQGVVIEIDEVSFYTIDEAIESERDIKKTMWIAVDSVTDPQNFASIIRSAVGLGFTTLVFGENRNCQITPSVEKIACGAIERIKMVRVVNLNQALIYLKDRNFWIYGADVNGRDVRNVEFNFPVVLVVGSEGEGLHKKTREHCDELVKIPQIKDFNSLNVSVAAGILMYEIRRRISE